MRLGERAWALLPALLAFVYALWLTSNARGAPDYDYWDMFTQLVNDDGFNITLSTLYKSSNEHIVILAKLVYLANHAITGGDNFGLSAFACMFSLVIATVLARMLSVDATNRTEALLLGALAAIAAFTPMAAHNFFIGMSGVAWLGANMLAVLAIAAFMRGHSKGSFGWFALAFFIALLAGQFYSTGVVAVMAVAIQALVLPSTRRLGAVLLAAGLSYLLIVYMLQKVPDGHASRTFDIAAIWAFVTTFVGAGLTRSLLLAQTWGTVGVIVFAALVARYVTSAARHRPAGAFWVAIACFALMNGGIAAISRSGMGAEAAAAASRYASLPSLFWIGLLGLSLSFRRKEEAESHEVPAVSRFAVGGSILLGCVAALTLIADAKPRVDALEKRSEGKPAAGLALALGVRDEALLRSHVTSVPSQIWAAEKGLRKIGQVPFNQVPDCPPPGTRLDVGRTADGKPPITGYLDRLSETGDGWFRIHGWALEHALDRPPLLVPGWPTARRDCLVIVNGSGTVIGVGIGGDERPDVAAHFGRKDTAYGWTAFARRSADTPGPTRVHAAVREHGTGRWLLLPEHIDLPPSAE